MMNKKNLSEKTEDEYDIIVADEAYKEYVESGKQSRPIAELFKELDLTEKHVAPTEKSGGGTE